MPWLDTACYHWLLYRNHCFSLNFTLNNGTVAGAWKAKVSNRNMAYFKGQPHPVDNITLNLNILASRQNINNLVCNFGAIYLRIMHAKSQASSSTGVGGEWGDIKKEGCHSWSLYKISTKFLSPPLLRSEGIILQPLWNYMYQNWSRWLAKYFLTFI